MNLNVPGTPVKQVTIAALSSPVVDPAFMLSDGACLSLQGTYDQCSRICAPHPVHCQSPVTNELIIRADVT